MSAPQPGLLAHHQRLLEASAIAPDVIAERGYWSATKSKELERWFVPTQRNLVPALVIPVYSVRGELEPVQIRPDEPRVVKGKGRKYELPSGCRLVLDVRRACGGCSATRRSRCSLATRDRRRVDVRALPPARRRARGRAPFGRGGPAMTELLRRYGG
jgi:hypothetical protein